MTDEEKDDNLEHNTSYNPYVQNVPKGMDEQVDDMAAFYNRLSEPTNRHALPYYKVEVDEAGIQQIRQNLVNMFTKELKTANLDSRDYDYIINTFNFAIMMIDNGIIGQTSMTLLHMIESRLMASNSKGGFLVKQMLNTVIKQLQTLDNKQSKGISFRGK